MSGSTWTWIGGTINLDSSTDWTLTSGPGNAAGIPQTGDTAVNTATLVGVGVIAASVINNGTIAASNNTVPNASTGGVLEIQGGISGTGSMTIAPGATLRVDGSLGSGQAITFSPGAPETLILGTPAPTMPNPITGYGLGDKIEFTNGITPTAASMVNGNTLVIVYHNAVNTSGTSNLTNVSLAAGTPLSFGTAYLDPFTNDELIMPSNFLTWIGPNGANFGSAINWNLGTVVPSLSDFVTFSNASGGTIGGTGTAFQLGFQGAGSWSLASGASLTGADALIVGSGGNIGTLTIGAGSTISSGGYIVAGNNAGSAGRLIVSGGGVLRDTGPASPFSYYMTIGNSAASGTVVAATGSVTVTGAGSLIDLGTNALVLANQKGTSGSLTVSNGGSVKAVTANPSVYNSIAIGRLGTGTLTVTDPGSQVTAVGVAYIAHTATGTLTVQNSAAFLALTDQSGQAGLIIGDGNDNGVGGTGFTNVISGGNLISQGYVQVGAHGTAGRLSVNGATVQAGTTIVVGNGGSITGTTGTIPAGTMENGDGTLNIGVGGTVELTGPAQTTSFGIYIANSNADTASTETGVATVSGAGALLNANGNGIAVGQFGTASLTVSLGGSVASGTPDSSLVSAFGLGRQGTGIVTVTDAGSQLTASGAAYIGRGGAGSLIVENQGSVVFGLDLNNAGGLSIGGSGTNSTGTLWTGGSGTVLVETAGSLFGQADINVGRNGATGMLAVQSGGTAEAGGRLIIGNTITLGAGASLISSTGTTAVLSPTIESSAGQVTVGAGGLLKVDGSGIASPGTAAVVIGNGALSSGALVVTGTGAKLNTGGYAIQIGAAGLGTMTVSQGGTVLAAAKFVNDAALTVGGASGGGNSLTLTDPGSQIDAVGQVNVGGGGTEQVLVENQATLISGGAAIDQSQGFDIAQTSGGLGSVIVVGNNSLLTNAGRFVVGDAGVGALSVQSGATVTTNQNGVVGLAGAVIANTGAAGGSSVDVSGSGSNWQVGGALIVGAAATGSLGVAAGASVTAGSLDAGGQAGSAGIVTLSGNASTLTTTGTIGVGDSGIGEFQVLNGATLNVGGDFNVGQLTGGSGVADFENPGGTVILGGNLNIGLGGGPAEVIIGLNSPVQFDNGGENVGANGKLIQYTAFDPLFANNTGVIDLAAGTTPYLAYFNNAGGTLGQASGVSSVLQSPTIYGAGGLIQVGAGSSLVLDVGAVSNQSIGFASNAGTLEIGIDNLTTIDVPQSGTTGFTKEANPNLGQALIGGFAGTINASFAATNTIVVDTTAAATFAVNGSVVTVSTGGSLAFATAALAQTAFSTAGALVDQVTCYAAGTRIETMDGPVAVEKLRVGDEVRTVLGGPGRIVWVGSREVNCAAHPRPKAVWPVRIARGAFGAGLPQRDLFVSPDHAIYLDGVLVPAKLLVNGTTVRQVKRRLVTYHHIELERHDVVLAEGLPAETYLDLGDRANFAGETTVRLFPDFAARLAPDVARVWETKGAAPLVMAGEKLAVARAVVAAHATRWNLRPVRGVSTARLRTISV